MPKCSKKSMGFSPCYADWTNHCHILMLFGWPVGHKRLPLLFRYSNTRRFPHAEQLADNRLPSPPLFLRGLLLMPANHKLTSLMLSAAVAVPLLYFAIQLIAAPSYPGYSFSTDTASMLGTAASRHPGIFNNGAILDGIAGIIGAVGLFFGLSGQSANWLRALVAIGVLSGGALSLKAGLFPMPDPRHASWQFLLFPILITPLLMLVATWRTSIWLRIYLVVNCACLLLMIPMMMHRMAPIWPEGTMQRLFAFVVMVPIGAVALALLRKSQPWNNPEGEGL